MCVCVCVCVCVFYEKFQSYVKRQSTRWNWVGTESLSIYFRPLHSVTVLQYSCQISGGIRLEIKCTINEMH